MFLFYIPFGARPIGGKSPPALPMLFPGDLVVVCFRPVQRREARAILLFRTLADFRFVGDDSFSVSFTLSVIELRFLHRLINISSIVELRASARSFSGDDAKASEERVVMRFFQKVIQVTYIGMHRHSTGRTDRKH